MRQAYTRPLNVELARFADLQGLERRGHPRKIDGPDLGLDLGFILSYPRRAGMLAGLHKRK
jgi:hypothetical protein